MPDVARKERDEKLILQFVRYQFDKDTAAALALAVQRYLMTEHYYLFRTLNDGE